MAEKRKILVLFAHPAWHKSRVNKTLIQKISNLENILVRDLYETYPNYHIDVFQEQRILQEHELIVWQHPFYWYSAPSILHEWIDLVLQHGFAYGKEGNALKGKSVFSTISAGGRLNAYSKEGGNRFTIHEFLSPFHQTALKCKMNYLPPFIIPGTYLLTEKEISQYADEYCQVLLKLQDKAFPLESCSNYEFLNLIVRTNP